MRLFVLGIQLAMVALVVFIAAELAPVKNLIPPAILDAENKDLTQPQFLEVLLSFVVIHLVFYVASLLINGSHAFSNFRRVLTELYFVICASSVASSYLFLLTSIPFSANFYLYIYILVPVFYLLAALLFGYLTHRKHGLVKQADRTEVLGSIRRFVLSPWAAITFVIMITPGILALTYKSNRDFADLVNYVRVSWNMSPESNWELLDVFHGRTFEQPMDIRFSPTSETTIYMLSRPGRLYRITSLPDWSIETVLDISDAVVETDLENGAISFALHPDFGGDDLAKSGVIYLYYTHPLEGSQKNRLSRFDVSLPSLDARRKSEIVVVEQEHGPSKMHNGGSVFFDDDGFLFFGIGDYTYALEMSQQIDRSFAGGIFRIDVDMRGEPFSRPVMNQPQHGRTQEYFIPLDNPFVGVDGALEEFWALGFRNPFRMSLDPETGFIWLGDVGRDAHEEVDRVAKGDNGQWPIYEGPELTEFAGDMRDLRDTDIGNSLPPYYSYAQTSLERAVIGGVVYRGTKFPELFGQYVFADNQSGVVRRMGIAEDQPTPVVMTRASQLAQQGITSLNESPSGDVYLTILGSKKRDSGQLVRLARSSDANESEVVPSDNGSNPGPTISSVRAKFEAVCSRCHGLDGRGLEIPAYGAIPDFSSTEWQRRVTNEHIRTVTERGGQALGLNPNMPAWAGLFTDSEMELLVELIRSFHVAEE